MNKTLYEIAIAFFAILIANSLLDCCSIAMQKHEFDRLNQLEQRIYKLEKERKTND